jgi:molybdenum cofactor cytidylyltransferase
MAESESERIPRLFAVVPAAGLSRRMGEPKLLLPLGGTTVIRRLLDSLRDAGVEQRIVVCRKDDDSLRREIDAADATVVQPDVDPPDMRTSVEHALRHIRESAAPAADDAWLLAPADHPVLNADVVRELLRRWRTSLAEILVPTFRGRRGHPTIFRWRLADAIAEIPPDRGLKHLLRLHSAAVEEAPVDDPGILTDLDTPTDLAALWQRFE